MGFGVLSDVRAGQGVVLQVITPPLGLRHKQVPIGGGPCHNSLNWNQKVV